MMRTQSYHEAAKVLSGWLHGHSDLNGCCKVHHSMYDALAAEPYFFGCRVSPRYCMHRSFPFSVSDTTINSAIIIANS